MTNRKSLLLISVLGFGAIVAGFAYHHHIVQVQAARLEHAVASQPYFPPGSQWTQDISHAPVDPQSSTIIDWLAGAGGWGNNNRMQVDFSMRVVQASANSPMVPFKLPNQPLPDDDQEL